MIFRVSSEPGNDWDRFVDQHSGLIFHFAIWGDILREAFNGDLFYSYLEKDGKIVCGLPGILIDLKLVRVLFSVISYGGIIGDRSYIPIFMESFDREMTNHRIHQVKIQGSPYAPYDRLNGFKSIQGVSHTLDLEAMDIQEVEMRYSPGTRRQIRKAEKLGVTIRPIQDRSDIPRFYQLYLSSMVRQNAVAKYPEKLFYQIYDRMVPIKKADFHFAYYQNRIVAGICLFYSKGCAHYFMGGSLTSFLNVHPNELLFHYAITQAVENNLKSFDFMGSPLHDKNLIRFKEKWGSHPVPIGTYIRDISGLRCALWNLAQMALQTRVGARLYGWISSREGDKEQPPRHERAK